MKWKFAPKGDYHPQQVINIYGQTYMVESVAHTGTKLEATTYSCKGYKGVRRYERILVVLTDEPPITEVTSEV